MHSKFLCFPYSRKVLCPPLMTCLILRWQPCWFTCSGGTGNFSQYSLLNLCPESIWFRSGRLRSSAFIASGSRSPSPLNRVVSSARRYQTRKILASCKSDGGQDGSFNLGTYKPKSCTPIGARPVDSPPAACQNSDAATPH